MNIPEIPQMYSGHGNFITSQAWAAVLTALRELDANVTALRERLAQVEALAVQTHEDLSTVAGALQEVVENA